MKPILVFGRTFLWLSVMTAMMMSLFFPVWTHKGFVFWSWMDGLLVLPASLLVTYEQTRDQRRLKRLEKIDKLLEDQGITELERLKEINRLIEQHKRD